MKLIRYGEPQKEHAGLLVNDQAFETPIGGHDWNEATFSDPTLLDLVRNHLKEGRPLKPIPRGSRLGSCVARPSKIICIGLNYSDHAREAGMEIPREPVIFFKSTTALCGPNDDLVIPRGSVKTDWEVELAVVIGKKASYVSEPEANDYIAGYCLHNDYSEREFQLERGGQWVKGKSNDTFAPLGPWLLSPDEIGNPHNLDMWLSVNGKTMQQSNTKNMVFKVPQLISYLSRFMTLLPGDVISTGTPAGVGLGFRPPVYLKPGDVIELGIEKLGSQRQVAKASP
jgi:2-keto-4-pentenoate hydratase/2-oxohepta-3-ene-1,7-dioic acid hydratase in catechol pathway